MCVVSMIQRKHRCSASCSQGFLLKRGNVNSSRTAMRSTPSASLCNCGSCNKRYSAARSILLLASKALPPDLSCDFRWGTAQQERSQESHRLTRTPSLGLLPLLRLRSTYHRNQWEPDRYALVPPPRKRPGSHKQRRPPALPLWEFHSESWSIPPNYKSAICLSPRP